jgi:hypothetical protein
MPQHSRPTITLPEAAMNNMSETAIEALAEHAPHLVTIPPGTPQLVTFDDIPIGEDITVVPDGYAGFNWDLQQGPTDPIEHDSPSLLVFDINYDGTREAINIIAQPYTYISRSDGETFDFVSFDAMDWYHGLGPDAERLIIIGLLSGEPVYSQEITLGATMSSYQFNYTDIDTLLIQTNAQDGWYDNNRGAFWMDNLLFGV